MNRTAKVAAITILITVAAQATWWPLDAQTPNVVIQWNQLALERYGPGASLSPARWPCCILRCSMP